MAYTDPNTGITHEGKEVARDPAGSGKSTTNYMSWAIGVALVVALAFAFFNMNPTDRSSTTSSARDTSVTQPVTPRTTPPAP